MTADLRSTLAVSLPCNILALYFYFSGSHFSYRDEHHVRPLLHRVRDLPDAGQRQRCVLRAGHQDPLLDDARLLAPSKADNSENRSRDGDCHCNSLYRR